MTQHLSKQQLEDYRKRSMPPTELLSADDHLAACAECRSKLVDEKKFQAAFAELRNDIRAIAQKEPEHVFYDQLEAYADNRLSEVDKEIVEAHFEICGVCKAEADDLLAFKNEMANFKKPGTEPSPSLRERFLNFFRLIGNLASPQLATAAAAILLAAVTVMLAFQTVILREELGSLRQANNELRKQTSLVSDLQKELDGVRKETEELRASNEDLQNRLINRTDPSSPGAMIALKDGNKLLTLDKQGNLAGLENASSDLQQAVKSALQSERIALPAALSELNKRQDRLMGENEGDARVPVLEPVGKIVRSDRPLFRWNPVDRATGYVLSIYDSEFNEAIPGQTVTATEWTASQPLKRGRIYYWQVAAVKGSEKLASSTAKFRVLGGKEAEELEKAERTGSHVVLGTVYAQAGLIGEAEKEFQALLDKNPQSETIKKLLQSVQMMKK